MSSESTPKPPQAEPEEQAVQLSHEDLKRLGREGQDVCRQMQRLVDEFRRDPSRNKYRWL